MRSQFLSISAICIASATAQAQATDSTGKSVWQGVYNESQAARGDTEHQNNCTSCHGTEKYSGEAFAKAWIGRTAFDLFDQLKTTMPDDNPGGLSVQQYTDIIAYIFKVNGMPAGTDSLSSDPEALRRIRIEAKPPGASGLLWLGVSHRAALLRPMYHPHRSPSASDSR